MTTGKMFTLKGYNHRTGEYQNRQYDYYQLFGTNDRGDWEMVKVNAKVLSESGIYDLNALIENKLNLLYNRYAKVEKITMA